MTNLNMKEPLRVAILGTASSGKTTLAQALARAHGAPWVPEYLREFVDTEGRVPAAADQFRIAGMQRAHEEAGAAQAAAQGARYVFCDTAPLMTAVYSRHYFGGIDAQLTHLVASHARDYDLTLLTAPDIPWVADGLQRECEQVSIIVHHLLLDELAGRDIPYLLVGGTLEQRLALVERRLERLA